MQAGLRGARPGGEARRAALPLDPSAAPLYHPAMQRKPLLERLKARAESLRRETYALYLAFREPGVPWYAKAFTALVVGYALSPVDLIPDFIPVLGYLDDLVLIPAGIALARKLIPAQVLADCRARAERELAGKKLTSRWAGAVIILVWTGVLALAVKAIFF